MELHERAQFDFLLNTAAERFTERLVQRTGGLEAGLAALRADPEGEGVWLSEFVRAVLRDFLLDNLAGSCFVLAACEGRRLPPAAGGPVADVLHELAVAAFAGVLAGRVEQAVEMHLSGHLG